MYGWKGSKNSFKGILAYFSVTPIEITRNIRRSQNTIQKMNPDYDIVIKRLHLYSDMKLVTFGIDRDRNLIIQFPVFVQPYTQ